MQLQDTIKGDSVSASLLETISILPPGVVTPEFPGTLPSRLNRQALAGPGSIQFQRKLRAVLKVQFRDLLLQLSPQLQARFLQLYKHAQETFSHTLRLLSMLDLAVDEQITIAMAAFFHDIGKLEIDEALLNKSTRLTPQEFAIIKQHPALGAHILNQFTSLENVGVLVYHHHERWDGDGYPDGLAGEVIPLGARTIAIADAFDAMTSDRSYQVQRTPLEALEELQRCAGTQFDPLLVELFFASRLISTRRTSLARSYPASH
ncbi:MAG TPA: HD domain-containing phosphohydrolase [Ktedonobacteraceae bacterium]|nr:HD domain-containing phosphohydrolase [Ktedonobacteraceae bacterium]